MRSFFTLVAIALFCAAASPSTQKERVSADGQALPPLEYKGGPLDTTTPAATVLAKLDKLMFQPPEALDHKIYDTSASGDMLARRMAKRPDPNAENGDQASPDRITTAWFCWGIVNADVVGFDLDDGVIRHLVLYYRNANAARELTKEIKANPDTPWRATRNGTSLWVERTIPDGVWYAMHHPELDKSIIHAMLHSQLVTGMTLDQATLTLGEPTDTDLANVATTYHWKIDEKNFTATVENGVITSVTDDK